MSGMSQAEYARHRGVSRAAITKMIDRGRIPESAFVIGDKGERLIDAAAADFALGETQQRLVAPPDGAGDEDFAGSDPTFGSNAGAARSSNGDNVAALTKARTATEIYRARTAELEYEQKVGQLLSVEDVTQAMARCATIIVRELEQLPNFADELAAALARDGVPGVRVALKNISRNVRGALEQNMRLAGAGDDEKSKETAS